MTAATTSRRNVVAYRITLLALVLLGTAVRVPQLFHTLFEPHSFRQTQTAFIAQQYAASGIDLLSTPLPVFGVGSNVPMELPLFQAIASLGVSVGLTADLASRILGLISFQSTAVLLALLLRGAFGRVVGLVAVVLLEFLPYGLFWGASSLIDFFAVALAMLMVLAVRNWLTGQSNTWLVVGVISAVGAFLVKVTTAPLWCLLLLSFAIVLIRQQGWRASWRRLLLGFTIAPGAGLAAAVAWTSYADAVKAANPSTIFLTSANLRDWNFGSPAQRLDPSAYSQVIHRVSSEIAGPLLFSLVLGVLATIVARRFSQRVVASGWIMTGAAGPLIFLNLYEVHSYYLIAIYPAVVAVMAIGIVWVVRLVPSGRWAWGRVIAAVLIAAILAVSVGGSQLGKADISGWLSTPPASGAAIVLRDDTPPGSRIVMVGCDWDPTYLYYAHREGLMLRGAEAAAVWKRQDIADYSYLYTCASGVDAEQYLPAGYTAVLTDSGGLYSIVRG